MSTGVGEEGGGDELLILTLVLELRHPLEVAHRCDRREVPGELGVLADVALHEQGRLRRIEAAGDEVGRQLDDARAEVLRVVRDGDRVRVYDTEERLFFLLLDLPNPGADGPEVVADVDLARRLDAGENAGFCLRRGGGGGRS